MQTNLFTGILDKRIRISFSIRTIFILIAFAFLSFYLIWEIYWYQKTGIIKWHAHFMLYAYLLVLGGAFFWMLGPRFFKIKKIAFSIWLGLFFLELGLMCWGGFKTYQEENADGYYNPYMQSTSYYHVGNKEYVINRKEFSNTYPLNSLGFPDREWDTLSPSNMARIIAFGDSFTFGDGAPYGKSYVHHLNRFLNKDDSCCYTMNAGFCGSDPFFNYVNLRDRLISYSPDIVIQCISSQDMLEDYAIRGGMSRFGPNGKLVYKNAPWWLPFYGSSYLLRPFIRYQGYDDILVKWEDSYTQQMMQDYILLFQDYVELCKKNNITLIIMIHPGRGELSRNKYDVDLSPLLNSFPKEKNVCVFDLLPYFKNYTISNKINTEELYWKLDGHHNPKGYEVMGQGVYEYIRPILDSLEVVEKADTSQVMKN